MKQCCSLITDEQSFNCERNIRCEKNPKTIMYLYANKQTFINSPFIAVHTEVELSKLSRLN